ncbi:acyl-CoA dehydrogenase, middle domain protein [Rhodococcus sp. MTM3W5.2]|nr:acyl-CoA dehydrogenase, middle domain protein [Rhodococcus sp. MTM3W5.2]
MPWDALLAGGDRIEPVELDRWYAVVRQRWAGASAFESAVLGGGFASTPGFAFLAGYQGGLRVLWPDAPATLGALCVTENRSTRPADLATRLDGRTLNGQKDFVTAGDSAAWLLVAAREDEAGASPRLVLTAVAAGAPGVTVESLPALALMPDIGHARLRLTDVPCERLPGDGWDSYVKPFRTIEDLYVLAALTAWLYGVGRDCGWPQELRLRLLGQLSGAAELARHDPARPATHLLLAGLFAEQDALLGDLDAAFAAGPAHWARLWERDRGVLRIAEHPRRVRLQRALAALDGTADSVR